MELSFGPPKLTLLLLTGVAACFDIRTRRIPNWLSLAGCASGLALNTALHALPGLQFAALGMAFGFVLYFPLWLLGARGAGDVKLLAAAGSIVGLAGTWRLALVAALVGGVFALALVIAKGVAMETARNVGIILADLVRFRRPNYNLRSHNAIRFPHALVLFLTAVIMLYIGNG